MSSILHQNLSEKIILLDLPKSISYGSGLEYGSAVAITRPHPSTEPKGTKRNKVLASIPLPAQDYYEQLEQEVVEALGSVRTKFNSREWCCPRFVVSPTSIHARGEYDDELHRSTGNGNITTTAPLILSGASDEISSLQEIQGIIVSNSSAVAVRVRAGRHSFLIPPQSHFLLSRIARAKLTLGHVFSTTPGILPRFFDCIVMDPPWANRSARRAKTYQTAEHQEEDPFYETLPIVHDFLGPSGTVAIWVTNKWSIREDALRRFDILGLRLWEEWIWVKTTNSGEPVTPVDGLWRKPYEILLLFRYEGQDHQAVAGVRHEKVIRRFIIAVPDHHSRKPGLKEPFELYLHKHEHCLEIFARNLTAGWFSWGDEVLKYNEETFCREATRTPSATG